MYCNFILSAFQSAQHLYEKSEGAGAPDPYILLMDPDPGGPKHADPDPLHWLLTKRTSLMGGTVLSVFWIRIRNLLRSVKDRVLSQIAKGIRIQEGQKGFFKCVDSISFQRTIKIWDPGSGITTPDHISERLVRYQFFGLKIVNFVGIDNGINRLLYDALLQHQ